MLSALFEISFSSYCIFSITSVPSILHLSMATRHQVCLMCLTFTGCYLSRVKDGSFAWLLHWTLESTNRSVIWVYRKARSEQSREFMCLDMSIKCRWTTHTDNWHFDCGTRNHIHMRNSHLVISLLLVKYLVCLGVHTPGNLKDEADECDLVLSILCRSVEYSRRDQFN